MTAIDDELHAALEALDDGEIELASLFVRRYSREDSERARRVGDGLRRRLASAVVAALAGPDAEARLSRMRQELRQHVSAMWTPYLDAYVRTGGEAAALADDLVADPWIEEENRPAALRHAAVELQQLGRADMAVVLFERGWRVAADRRAYAYDAGGAWWHAAEEAGVAVDPALIDLMADEATRRLAALDADPDRADRHFAIQPIESCLRTVDRARRGLTRRGR